MEPNKNSLFFLGFIVKRTDKETITISDTRYKDENCIIFKKIDGVMVLVPGEGITPSDLNEHWFVPISIYTHIAEAADVFFNNLNEIRDPIETREEEEKNKDGKACLAILKILKTQMPRNTCYGIRLLNDDSIEMFYHPFGCEEEIRGTLDNISKFLNKIEKCTQ